METNPDEYFMLSLIAAQQAGWHIKHVSHQGWIGERSDSPFKLPHTLLFQLNGNLATITSQSTQGIFHSFGRNRTYVRQLINTIQAIAPQHSAEELEVGHAALGRASDEDWEEALRQRQKNFLDLFVPRKGYVVTPVLLYLNLAVYLSMVFAGVSPWAPQKVNLLQWGANYMPLTMNGQWWRLFTCFFLHIGPLHLLVNMYALIYIGLLIEPALGWARFLAIYLIAGCCGSLCSVYYDFMISAGASGAIFGLYGAFLAMLNAHAIHKYHRVPFLTGTLLFVTFSMLSGFRSNSNVDNAGHVGGLLGGILAGYILALSLRRPASLPLRYGTLSATVPLALLGSWLAYRQFPQELLRYEERLIHVQSLEASANQSMQSLNEYDATITVANTIEYGGIYQLNQALMELNDLDALPLPRKARRKHELLKEYFLTRIRFCEFYKWCIYQDIPADSLEMNLYENKIDSLLELLIP